MTIKILKKDDTFLYVNRGEFLDTEEETEFAFPVKWKKIRPGLGKTQRGIMNILEKHKERNKELGYDGELGGNMDTKPLASLVYNPELDLSKMPRGPVYPITRSQFNSVHRAAKTLEKRGLVRTHTCTLPDCYPITNVRLIETKEAGS